MAKKPEEFAEPLRARGLLRAHRRVPRRVHDRSTRPSMIVADAEHQELATGFPIGKRFKSAPVVRVCDANPCTSGTRPRPTAAGASTCSPTRQRRTEQLGGLADGSPSGWRARRSRRCAAHAGGRRRRRLVRRQGRSTSRSTRRRHRRRARRCSCRETGPFGLIDYEKVYAADPAARHLRAARHRPRRRRRRRAPRPVRGERAAADGDGGAGRVLPRTCCRTGDPRRPPASAVGART